MSPAPAQRSSHSAVPLASRGKMVMVGSGVGSGLKDRDGGLKQARNQCMLRVQVETRAGGRSKGTQLGAG